MGETMLNFGVRNIQMKKKYKDTTGHHLRVNVPERNHSLLTPVRNRVPQLRLPSLEKLQQRRNDNSPEKFERIIREEKLSAKFCRYRDKTLLTPLLSQIMSETKYKRRYQKGNTTRENPTLASI